MNFINFHAVNDEFGVRDTKKLMSYMEQTDNTPAIFVEEKL